MARTHRAHLSKTALAKRGGKLAADDHAGNKPRRDKSYKQRRVNERAQIRKEFL